MSNIFLTIQRHEGIWKTKEGEGYFMFNTAWWDLHHQWEWANTERAEHDTLNQVSAF